MYNFIQIFSPLPLDKSILAHYILTFDKILKMDENCIYRF